MGILGLFKKTIPKQIDTPVLWVGKNTIESVRDDGHIVYKMNRVNYEERKLIGFYGLKHYSESGNFCAVYSSETETEYNLALIDVLNNIILFRMKLNPRRCRVTDCGILICEDIGKHKQKSRYLFIFDKFGNPLLRNVHRDYIGDIFDLVDDQSVFKYELNTTHRKLEINLKELIK